jgi:hypothetical protein
VRVKVCAMSMCLLIGLLPSSVLRASDLPKVVKTQTGGQLIVDGKPYLILGGELGNSSAGTAAQADDVLPRVRALNVNTVLMPVAWEQIEPSEGRFDFSVLDHWMNVARAQHLHLVLLWFGSWKNAFSEYAPLWVKQDTTRFPRAIGPGGLETEILSTVGSETLQADSHAFAALMAHVREKDAAKQTVLMVQVENEVGYLGPGRDRSKAADELYESEVPASLMKALQGHQGPLSEELQGHFDARGRNWKEVFGNASDEVFMAWNYARFADEVAEAGKKEYALPMYMNAQLPAPAERAGEYPSGGPHPYYLDVYRAVAKSIDFYSPDIYWPDFEHWIQRYEGAGMPVFVPEARLEAAPLNALYAYGAAGAFGFSAFSIDSVTRDGGAEPAIAQTYGMMREMTSMVLAGQAAGTTRALVLHATSPRASQTVALGGYLMQATLSRSWPAKALLEDDGAMLVVQAEKDEFYVAGQGLTLSFIRDPDVDDRMAGIGSIEEVSQKDGAWVTTARLNGDQSNQGRQLMLAPKQERVYRVRLYSVARGTSATN